MEDVCGVSVTDQIRLMRRLLYCGEWIESHALHMFLLHAPDFLGYESVIDMAADHPAVVESALRLKKAGNDLMDVVGGRSVHPINVKLGGFYRMPTVAELLRRAAEARAQPRGDPGGHEAPGDLRLPRHGAAVRVPLAPARSGATPSRRGDVVTSAGKSFRVQDFTKHIEE